MTNYAYLIAHTPASASIFDRRMKFLVASAHHRLLNLAAPLGSRPDIHLGFPHLIGHVPFLHHQQAMI